MPPKFAPQYLVVFLCLFLILFSCTERYHPAIDGNFSALVVDGKITNEDGPYEIKLFQTLSLDSVKITDSIVPEINASIQIFNDSGESDFFSEIYPGVYRNQSLDFKGEVGQSYWIKIRTADGVEYESVPELMKPPMEIINMYGQESVHVISNDSEIDAVKFYFDAKDETNQTSYLRWEALESWEWHSPFYLAFTNNPSRVCFPTDVIDNINVYDASQLKEKEILKLPITFSTKEEQKLNYEYYIRIFVRSISKQNYLFWNHIKKISQSSGSLFDAIPGNIEGNVFSCDGGRSVVGYFEVSSISVKGTSFSESMYGVEFDDFPPECVELHSVNNPPDPAIYYVLRIVQMGPDIHYYFRRKKCYDCNVEYSPTKPSFWK